MATQTTPTASNTLPPPHDDVVRRNLPRELPCKLDDAEFTRIAKTRAQKEAERDELEDDLSREKKKRTEQINDLNDEIAKMGRELRTGEQERTVKCNEVFRKLEDGTGWIFVIRQDTFSEVERRPATAHETQRYLPSLDGGSLLDQAARKQRSAQDEKPAADASSSDDVPADDAETDGESTDEDDAPKKRGGKKGK
jgi:hypothetical protein